MATQCRGITHSGARCKNLTNDSSGYCPAHRNQAAATRRSARTTSPAPAPVPVRRNNRVSDEIAMGVGFLALLLLAGLIWALFLRPSPAVAPATTVVEAPAAPTQPAPGVGYVQIDPTPMFVYPEGEGSHGRIGAALLDCKVPKIAWGETRDIQPGETFLGDVVVDGVIRYDIGGSDEATVVINLSSKAVPVFAEWGAGCKQSSDVNKIVTMELFETGCGDSSPCSTVRVVFILDAEDGHVTYSQTFYKPENVK